MKNELPMGIRFSILHRAFKQQMDERLKEWGLTGVQFGVLGQISRLEKEYDGEINQKMLETLSRVTHPTMTEIIKKLEKKGFISCETSSVDRRHKSIRTTPKALQLHSKLAETDKNVFGWLSKNLSEEQVAQFISITDIMLETIFENCEKGCEKNCD